MAIRNSIFRHPYPPDNEEFKRFTNSFHHELTPDQIKCNEVSINYYQVKLKLNI